MSLQKLIVTTSVFRWASLGSRRYDPLSHTEGVSP